MNALLTLVRPFVSILAHRDGPEDLPASQFLLGLVIVAHVSVYFVALTLLKADSARLYGMPFIDTAAQIVFFAGLLSAMGLKARILQTLTAAFGADALLNALIVPIALAINSTGTESSLAPVLSLALLAIMLWSLGVKGHILHRAVGFPYVVGVVIALGFVIVMISLERALFPA